MLIVLLIIQLVSLVVLIFGDIGFDHPGRFGLSYEHGLFLSLVYGGALLAGLGLSFKRKKWFLFAPQLLIPASMIAVSFWPAPALNANDYGHLLGKTRETVEQELGVRGTITGLMQDDRGEFEFVSYNGFTVYYQDGVVDRITPE